MTFEKVEEAVALESAWAWGGIAVGIVAVAICCE